MSDITANVVVSMPSQLFTMARSFKSVANGKIYIGKIDTDPVNPENQIQVYLENEDGTHVPVSQPIIINAAGYPVYNGQIAKFVTVQGHSMAVYDAYGSQQFYFPNVLKYDPDQFGPDFKDQLAQDGSYIDDDTKGDALIGFKQHIPHAVMRTVDEKFIEFVTPQDAGVKNDGSDCTSAWQNFVADVNAIPNPDGVRIGVYIPSGKYKFSSGLIFTRPVHIFGSGVEIEYIGSGNAITLGPDDLSGDYNGLTGKTPFHKTYSVDGLTFKGGTTSGYAINFAHWVPDCRIRNCEFKAFGGDGAWAINAEYNNWLVTVEQCIFWGHFDLLSDTGNTRNFVRCPGYMTNSSNEKVMDLWSTRLNAINNRVFGTGWERAGTAYMVSGWKSRIIGGSIEGMLSDIIIAAGCNDVEISTYVEKNFSGKNTEVPDVVHLSYPNDPYFIGGKADGGVGLVDVNPSPWIKRLNVSGYYNLHNNSHDARFLVCGVNLYVEDLILDKLTFVHSYHELIGITEIIGHKNWYVGDISFDGDFDKINYLLEPSYASLYKTSFKSRVKNLLLAPNASSIEHGFTGAAPINTSFGAIGLSAISDGVGGYFTVTKRETINNSAGGYERNRLDMHNNAFLIQCSSPATDQSYFQLQFEASILPEQMQGASAVLSFYAKAYNSHVDGIKGTLSYSPSGVMTEGDNSVSISTDYFFRKFIHFKIGSMPLGADISTSERVIVSINFPVGSVFSIDIASAVFTIGDIAYPLTACF